MSKKKEDTYVPREVKIRVRIEPAFRLVIESDDTGKGWGGHTWYGDTGMSALRKMRNSVNQLEYSRDILKVSASTPERVAAISWKEEVYE